MSNNGSGSEYSADNALHFRDLSFTQRLQTDSIYVHSARFVDKVCLTVLCGQVPVVDIVVVVADVTLSYFQKNGFTTPLLVKDKSGLGLR